MKDVSVKMEDGKRQYNQKRLTLCNLSELYQKFKMQYPDIKIGFYKFAQVRPPHCVIAEASGSHTVCVCVHHENVNLMLDGIDLENLTEGTDLPLNTCKNCL